MVGKRGGDEEESLAEAFWNVAAQLRRRSRTALAPWDVSPSHSRALGVLMHHGEMRLNSLADHLHIAARSTTEVVDALQDRGLVERRPDLDDRRATLVALTAEGTAVGQAIQSARSADTERYFAVLNDTDRAQLRRVLRKLRQGQ